MCGSQCEYVCEHAAYIIGIGGVASAFDRVLVFVRVCRRVSMLIARCYSLSSLDSTEDSTDGRPG